MSNEQIKNNSKQVYDAMKRMCHYSFWKLQQLCRLDYTELCLAILQLLKEGKIEQDRDDTGVYYYVQ